MRSTLRSLVNAPRTLLIAILLIAAQFIAAQFSTTGRVSAAVPPDAGAACRGVSPLRLDTGDSMRIVPNHPYPSDLSPSEEFARRLLVRTKQRIVVEPEPQPVQRPAIDPRGTFGATGIASTLRRTAQRVEDRLEQIQLDLEVFLAKIPVLGPDVVRGVFLSDADAIQLPTSADAEATMAELERFPIWIYDDSRFWRERRRLTWTEIGRPLKLRAFVGIFPRSVDDTESSSALYRTTSGQEFIEAWETLRASDGVVMSLRSPLADFWEYFERERYLSTLSVHFYQGPYAPSRYVVYYLIPPPEDISERIRDALFSIKLRRPDQPGEAVRETPIELLTIRRKPRVPIWVSPVVRQDLDDATIEEMKKPFEIWSRPFGEVHGSTGTYR
jgi:hypothetical protein